jgi:hypothetical protein
VGSVLFSYLYRSSPLWSVSVPVRALGSFLPESDQSVLGERHGVFQCP